MIDYLYKDTIAISAGVWYFIFPKYVIDFYPVKGDFFLTFYINTATDSTRVAVYNFDWHMSFLFFQ